MTTATGFLRKIDFKAVGLGYFVMFVSNQAFDYGLYPYVIYRSGIFWGGIVMTLLSAAFCLLAILIYDLLKKDFLGVEAIKDFKQELLEAGVGHKNFLRRFMAWAIRKGRWAEFVILSLKFDPFVTTVYLRRGVTKFSGFGKEEWKVFVGSLFLSNFYWTVLSFSGVEVLLLIFERI